MSTLPTKTGALVTTEYMKNLYRFKPEPGERPGICAGRFEEIIATQRVGMPWQPGGFFFAFSF